MIRILGIIPARYASTRFPAKPLVDIEGKSMVQRVHEQACKASCLTKVIVATDHHLIYDHVKAFKGDVCMTKETHASGTDRCYEVASLQPETYDYIINIQGDEPFIQPEQINLLGSVLDGSTEIATLIKCIDQTDHLFNANIVKTVINKNKQALYFSRTTIPYIRNASNNEWLAKHTFYKHIGMYAYRNDILKRLRQLEISPLEKAESLEQLRWLENGFAISTVETQTETLGIDTPEDLIKAMEILKNQS